MTTNTDIVNRALQTFGTRTTVTDAELANSTTNEAIQANLILTRHRDNLLRMAPWDCALKFTNLIYLTSVPGTPENTSPATNIWLPGQPAPPWAYEYWYPDDCLRACYLIPTSQTGFASGVPITTAVTGGAPSQWTGQPVKYKVATDQFRSASGLSIATAGTGFQINDTAIFGVSLVNQSFNAGAVPAGIVQIKVTGVNGSGGITTATLQNFSTVLQNALLFSVPTYNLNLVQTTGIGTGAAITVTGVSQTQFDNRVILTNQEFAAMAYIRQITDPNVMDPLFQEAWAHVLGSGLCLALTGDKTLANGCIHNANEMISQARKADGNEGLTINDVTPDWICIRGIAASESYSSPWAGFDWGGSWPTY